MQFRQLLSNDTSIGPLADFDGDGDDELICYGPGHTVWLFEVDGSSTQLPQACYPNLGQQSNATWDADGDGSAELLVATMREGLLRAVDMQGKTVFESTSYDWGWNTADVDGDGKKELLVAPKGSVRISSKSSSISEVHAISWNGKKVWSKKERMHIPLLIGDLDGDKKEEMLVGGADFPGATPHVVGMGTKWSTLKLPSGAGGNPAACVDITGDGKDEVIFYQRGFLNVASGVFTSIKGFKVGSEAGAFDLDGDGSKEIVTGDSFSGQWSAYSQSGKLVHRALIGDYLRGPVVAHTKKGDYLLLSTSYSGTFIYP